MSLKPTGGVSAELTQADLECLCRFFELLDKWDREDQAAEPVKKQG